MEDKRKFRRGEASFAIRYQVRSPVEVRLEFGVKEQEAIACDLSEGGLALFLEHPLPAGAVIDLSFRLFNQGAAVEAERARKFALQAETRYSQRMPDKSYRVGVRFLNTSSTDREFIASVLRSLRAGSA